MAFVTKCINVIVFIVIGWDLSFSLVSSGSECHLSAVITGLIIQQKFNYILKRLIVKIDLFSDYSFFIHAWIIPEGTQTAWKACRSYDNYE